MTPQFELIQAIEKQGFNINDCPFVPFQSHWEQFPIIKAIRQAEKETGIKYTFSESDYESLTD